MIDFVMNFPRMLEGFLTIFVLSILVLLGLYFLADAWLSDRRRKKNATTKKS